jgi:uncharacterized repeat protein (TIGR03806 family)
MNVVRRAHLWLALAALVACGGDEAAPEQVGPAPEAYESPPATLEEWHLFRDAAAREPGPRTVPYDVISPLFSDYSAKQRFIYLPEGKKIGYDDEERWKFPEGAILIKSFGYGERLLETRLLVVTKDGVVPHTYVWNDAQTVAERKVAGKTIPVEFMHEGVKKTNDYRVPNTNQCHDCHGKPEATLLLGPRTRQLDRSFDYGAGPVNQLDHMAELGLFDRAPAPAAQRERLVDPFGSAPLVERARAYLDSNCAHCHGEGGDASSSGLWLTWLDTGADANPTDWGVCKRPTSAAGATCGHEVDIVPGDPESSIYMCRLESRDSKVQMPPVGTNLVHTEGVELLRAWIEQLPGSCD